MIQGSFRSIIPETTKAKKQTSEERTEASIIKYCLVSGHPLCDGGGSSEFGVMEDTAPAQTYGLKIQHPSASRTLASSLQMAVHPHMWQPRREKEKLLRMQDLQTSSLDKSYKMKVQGNL